MGTHLLCLLPTEKSYRQNAENVSKILTCKEKYAIIYIKINRNICLEFFSKGVDKMKNLRYAQPTNQPTNQPTE